ncbi:hypothetical protein NLI96_g2064 [Meripilus lineatus]|uniref:Uncharacterized protein n=1 Tax=Meripilus lineatus TaxID=2056292 RepID=A0AAD5VBH4_9APHY|nr:hypothetical protein NLI96_g2064 [Physisporinus lineatus]
MYLSFASEDGNILCHSFPFVCFRGAGHLIILNLDLLFADGIMQFGIISPLVLMATAHAVAALPSYQTGYDKVTRDVASGSNTFGGYNMPDTSQPCWHSSTHDVNAVSFVDSDTRDEYSRPHFRIGTPIRRPRSGQTMWKRSQRVLAKPKSTKKAPHHSNPITKPIADTLKNSRRKPSSHPGWLVPDPNHRPPQNGIGKGKRDGYTPHADRYYLPGLSSNT